MCSPLLAAGACEVQRFVCLLAHPCQFRSQALMELVYKVLENIMEQVSFLYLVSCSWTYNDEEGCQESSHPSCLSKAGFAAWRKTVWSESESTGCWSSGHVSKRHLDWVLLAEWRKNTQVAGAYSPGQRPGKADQDGGDEVDWGGAWGIGRNQLQC